MRYKHRLYILIICIYLFGNNAWAYKFSKKDLLTKTKFSYTWQDHSNKTQKLSFFLDNILINNQYRRFKKYNSAQAKNAIYKALLKQAKNYNPREIQIKFNNKNKQLNYLLKGKDTEQLNKVKQELEKKYETAFNDYLKKSHYMKFHSPWAGLGIKPDHITFAKEGADYLAPIAKAILKKTSIRQPRKVIDFVLSWVQSIPYSDLENRTESSGAGYNPPIRVLTQNIGDCDSKVTLVASIIKNIYPRLNISLIYMPNHALMGFQLPTLKSDITTEINGHLYILAEPVGPALMPLSEITPSSQGFVNSNGYFHEVL